MINGKKILVIPDAHARPEQDNSRFDALGAFIAHKQPDIVVSIGDWADMASLCSYDKGTKAAEGRRYQDDIDAANNALARTMAPVKAAARAAHRKLPEFHITLGNHENRINRAASESPELFGKLSMDDIHFKKWGWTVHPFLKPLVIENILFQHYLTSGGMGRPVGGVNHARSLIIKGGMSCVVGHSHERGFAEQARADGKKVIGLVVGCYDEGEHAYANGSQHNWWSGLCMLHEVKDGQHEHAWFSTDYVKARYG